MRTFSDIFTTSAVEVPAFAGTTGCSFDNLRVSGENMFVCRFSVDFGGFGGIGGFFTSGCGLDF